MWAKEGLCDTPSMITIGLIALCGGLLGVLMMIPLRSALIVKEHGVLGYPEGQACAEVLIAGERAAPRRLPCSPAWVSPPSTNLWRTA